MINISSYQVYDNCVGDCVVPSQSVEVTVESDDAMEAYRNELRHKHRKDVEEYREKIKNKKPKEKDITVYLMYKEK